MSSILIKTFLLYLKISSCEHIIFNTQKITWDYSYLFVLFVGSYLLLNGCRYCLHESQNATILLKTATLVLTTKYEH